MLRIEGLRAGYDQLEVLHDLALEVGDGASVVVLGANGAGKSTLCRAISGLISCGAGRILLDGEDMTALAPSQRVRRGIVQVPEGRQVFPEMTVRENLQLGGWVHGRPSAAAFAEIFAIFPRLGERTDQNAGLLSGGEQQLLALGRAMMARPRLLVLDEPTQGLSPVAVEQVAEAIAAIRSRGVAVLLVEQNLALAEAVSDHAYVLETGRCVASGPAADILAGDALVESYLGH